MTSHFGNYKRRNLAGGDDAEPWDGTIGKKPIGHEAFLGGCLRVPMSREMRMAGCPSYGGVPESWIMYLSDGHMCGFPIDKRVCVTIYDEEKCGDPTPSTWREFNVP